MRSLSRGDRECMQVETGCRRATTKCWEKLKVSLMGPNQTLSSTIFRPMNKFVANGTLPPIPPVHYNTLESTIQYLSEHIEIVARFIPRISTSVIPHCTPKHERQGFEHCAGKGIENK